MATAFHQVDGAPPGLAEAAIRYAANGWPVFPLKPRAKKPITTHGLLDATTDPGVTAERWRKNPDANIGIRTGPNPGFFVLDVDGQTGKDSLAELEGRHGKLPPTLTQRTGNGDHFIFRYPDSHVANNNTGKVGKGLDIRGNGGYIVVEPSIHPNGTRYEWLDPEAPIADAPPWLLARVKGENPTPLLTRAASGTKIPRGDRHRSLVSVAGKLRHNGAGEAEILAELLEFNSKYCEPAKSVAEVEKIARDVAERYPAVASPWAPTPSEENVSDARASDRPDLTHQPQTDAGNAERFFLLHGKNTRYVRELRAWDIWNGLHWENDKNGAVERWAIDTARETYRQAAALPKDEADKLSAHSRKSEGAKAIRATLELLRCMDGVTISAVDRDADPYLLGLPNGTLDLRTGQLVPPCREHLITKTAAAAYDPHAQCPTWLQFLGGAMGMRPDATEEQRQTARVRVAFLQKAAGLSLSGLVDDKAAFALFGPTNSGKTTFLEAVRHVLGDYAGQILVSSLLANGRQSDNNSQADLADLHGIRFATTSEAESGQRLDAAKFKYLTQGQASRIKVARKYQNPFEFRASHKLFIDSNERPDINAVDDATWGRIHPVRFEFRVPADKIDRTLPAKLRAEASGMLRWLLDGFQLHQAEGLGNPPDVAAARQEWREECDPLADFLAESYRVDPGSPDAFVLVSELRSDYEAFSANGGERFAIGAKKFNARLKALGCLPGKVYTSGKEQRVWKGIERI